MSSKATNTPGGLRTTLAQILQAYKSAQDTHIKTESEAHSKQQQRLNALQEEQKSQKQQIESDHQHAIFFAIAEKEQVGRVLATIEQTRQASYELLKKASIDHHVSDTPLQLDASTASFHYTDADSAKDLAIAQQANTELKSAILQLAKALTDLKRWKEARQVLSPLMENTHSSLYAEVRDLHCRIYYDSANAALLQGDWAVARQDFRAAIAVHSTYKDAKFLLRESYLRPARQLCDARQFEQARREIESWLKKN